MTKSCAVKNCHHNDQNKKYLCHYIRFPRDRLREWVRICGKELLAKKDDKYLLKNCYVCTCHFNDNEYHIGADGKVKLNCSTVPTININVQPLSQAEIEQIAQAEPTVYPRLQTEAVLKTIPTSQLNIIIQGASKGTPRNNRAKSDFRSPTQINDSSIKKATTTSATHLGSGTIKANLKRASAHIQGASDSTTSTTSTLPILLPSSSSPPLVTSMMPHQPISEVISPVLKPNSTRSDTAGSSQTESAHMNAEDSYMQSRRFGEFVVMQLNLLDKKAMHNTMQKICH